MLTYILSDKESAPAKPQAQTSKAPSFEVKLSAEPATIKAAGTLDPAQEIDKIPKSILKINLTNHSDQKLTKINVRFKVEGENQFGFGNLPNSIAQSNSESLPPNYPGASFDIPDINPKAVTNAEMLFFARNKGSLKITATVKTADGGIQTSHPVTITVE